MTRTSRTVNTARNVISGAISGGATWYEDVTMTDNGTVITNADTWDWRMTFRDSIDDDSSVLTLSTDDGTLTITQNADSTTLGIRVAASSLSSIDGDKVADIESRDSDGRIIHWGHGIVTFPNAPPTWS